jgi:hypothetical protein
VWSPEYTFSSQYGQSGISYSNLGNVYQQLQTNSELFDQFLSFWAQETDQKLPSNPARDYLCAIANIDNAALDTCLGKKAEVKSS